MQIADHPHPLAQKAIDSLMRYREQLLAAGFHEPTRVYSRSWHWLFYKPLTNLTAFIVNLKRENDRVEIVYGCASTAFTLMANDQDALTTLGVSDDEITVRAGLTIRSEADEIPSASAIRQMYDQLRCVEKDALLDMAKEKRKAFIRQIAGRLKPLGFRKQGNRWTRLREGYAITFHLQKSSYADLYYFNVGVHREGINAPGCCYDQRISPEGERSGSWRMDWQLFPPEALADFLDQRLIPHLIWLIDTPFAELGADPALWSCCDCQRKHCNPCWVQKNLWEAVQAE